MRHLLVVLALVSATAFAADQSSKPTTIDGWVSDSKCGAMHAGSGASCVKKCVEGGAKPVFVDDAKKDVWSIDDPASVNSHSGSPRCSRRHDQHREQVDTHYETHHVAGCGSRKIRFHGEHGPLAVTICWSGRSFGSPAKISAPAPVSVNVSEVRSSDPAAVKVRGSESQRDGKSNLEWQSTCRE